MIPTWLISSQPPLKQWLALLARMVVGAFVAAAIVTLLNFPNDPAAWSVVAVVVVIGYNAGASTVAGINRMQGSIVGCLTGGITQMLLGGRLWLPFVAAIAVGLSVWFCRLLRVGAGFRLGGALAGFFIFVPGDEEWATVGWRLAATVLGIGVGMLVMLLWPARADRSVRLGIAEPIRDCVEVVDGSIARWLGESEPADLAATVKRLQTGTSSVAAALTERAHERAGAWQPSTYSTMITDLNDAMLTARRLHKVAAHETSDSLHTNLKDPFGVAVTQCRVLALQVADVLDSGVGVDRSALLDAAERVTMTPIEIQSALEQMRAEHLTRGATAEELQRLFAIALLLGHWSESVSALARDLATT